ncbi:winged helix-turn-helix domain-containing protein [Aeromonas sp. FDAARGOS 1419]|uniref:winged helix-turn-helix domain-containing protein n=1 Tax=Aeromonas sp. FDAARGOS 1419 TaxID=2778068 RepID=UPI001C219894|nr:winged helix-turn-helix domain-containing protein [Aeromonas sp. FDAARGOS 1419]QWZ78105.1 winged helix-turn-helix domain-containing protein [Aeromonas sp. FDAARGOS 1419]
MRVLLVEDDKRLADVTAEYLDRFGFSVDIELRGDVAARRILAENPDVVILDLLLPGMDGLEVCRQIRPYFTGIVVMLTAVNEDADQVLGLEIGADDYIAKPVQPRVLLARLRALTRRTLPAVTAEPETTLRFGKLEIMLAARTILLNGREILLTTAEFDLLWLLASHAGEVLGRDELMSKLRGIDYDGIDRSMNVRIARLRKKLDDNPEQPQRIKTVRGKGYLFSRRGWD